MGSSPVLREREGLLSFIVVVFTLAGSPGQNTLSLAATGVAFGARRGLGYLIRLVVGMAQHLSLPRCCIDLVWPIPDDVLPLLAVLTSRDFKKRRAAPTARKVCSRTRHQSYCNCSSQS